jgi:hypothetical protein
MAKSDAGSDAPAAEAAAEADAPMVTFDAAAQASPSSEDIVCRTPLAHDNVYYTPGAIIPRSVFTDAQFKGLRADGVIAYRHETAKPEEFAAEYADLQSELGRKTAENARLIAELKKAGVDIDSL